VLDNSQIRPIIIIIIINEKERLKKEYVRRLRLILNTELSAKNKIKQLDHW
jgi:hypothetical protein